MPRNDHEAQQLMDRAVDAQYVMVAAINRATKTYGRRVEIVEVEGDVDGDETVTEVTLRVRLGDRETVRDLAEELRRFAARLDAENKK